jgi:hypothetical protein
MRGPHRGPGRQGRCLPVLQELSPRGDRADPDARMGARLRARVAAAIRQATVVNRLVSDPRPQARRRGTRAIPSPRLACVFHRHRHLRQLGCGRGRRPPKGLIPRRKGAFDGLAGTYSARWQPARRADAPDRDGPGSDGWHELAVANPAFLLERLGSECTDLQGLRELTVNGLDAINAWGLSLAAGSCGTGTGCGSTPRAAACASCRSSNTGTGMTAGQLRRYN